MSIELLIGISSISVLAFCYATFNLWPRDDINQKKNLAWVKYSEKRHRCELEFHKEFNDTYIPSADDLSNYPQIKETVNQYVKDTEELQKRRNRLVSIDVAVEITRKLQIGNFFLYILTIIILLACGSKYQWQWWINVPIWAAQWVVLGCLYLRLDKKLRGYDET